MTEHPPADATPRTGLDFELDAAQREALANAARQLLEQVRAQRERSPIFVPTPPAQIDAMLRAPGEDGRDLATVFAALQGAAGSGWNKAHGGDLAYIPSGGLYAGAVAAWLASGLHVFSGVAFEAPALVALEESVLRWLAAVMGLPAGSEGLLLSGGSIANQTAVVCARERPAYEHGRSVAYLSERAHHSLPKALHLSGIPKACVRAVPVDEHLHIDVAALRRLIADDLAAGRRPWLVAGVAGSTDIGSIDALDTLATIAREHDAWFHVDAAYGGLFMLTERGQARLQGIARADSITVDAHKGLQLPYGVAALLVRRPGALAQAHEGSGAYLRDLPEWPGLPHYFGRGPELTRPFRGLLAWLPLQLHGVQRFRAALDRALDLAARAARELRELPGIVVLHEPELSIVAFRCAAGDAATAALLAAINGSGRLHVSSTELGGRLAIRLAFLNFRSGAAELDAVLELVRAGG